MRKPVARLQCGLIALCFFCSQFLAAQNCPSGEISGHIFQDFNFNGLADETATTGILGVEVLLFKPVAGGGSMPDGSTMSDAMGNWSFSGKTDGVKYRVEFILPASLAGLKPTFFGMANATSVQFVTAPSCSVDAAFAAPDDFCTPNPFLATPCYVNGDPNGGGDAGPLSALIGLPYAATGTGQSSNSTLDNIADVGACWGMAFQKETKTLFSASVLRRHSGFGPGGPGAIYVHDLSNFATPQKIATINLAALGVPVGTDPRIADPLPTNIITPSYDSLAFPLIGKFGIGDIDISADGKYLYVVCLTNRTLYKIFINKPFQMPTAADVTAIPMSDPGCGNANDWRPWGLKIYRGEVYVGIVCTAESTQMPTGMMAFVKKLNPMGGFDPVFDFSINYPRGAVITGVPVNSWNPWTNNWATITANGGNGNYPQPLLSDIEFDIDGSMILGFLDRTAIQGGYLNYGPGFQYNSPTTTFSGGDIVRVCKNSTGNFELENATGGCKTPLGMANGEGPGGGEFYWDETFENSYSNMGNPFIVHHETSLGSLALVPGKGEVISGVFDPLGFNTGGISWYNNTTGKCSKSYEIYPALPGFAGKSAGIGDIEALCPPAPIEKGNFVWKDINKDGVQDPNEPPLVGINVSLFDNDCILIKTVQTNAVGEYYFNKTTIATGDSIQPGVFYYIVVGADGQFDNGLLLDSLQLTVANTGFGAGADLNDSDGMIDPQNCTDGLPFAQFTATTNGADHGCDFGFYVGCQIMIDAILAQNETCAGSKDGSLTIMASGSANIQYSINGGQTFQPTGVFTGLMPGNYNIVVAEIGNPDCTEETSRVILPGITVNPPSAVNPYSICQNENTPAGGGLTATCGNCPSGFSQNITWWTALTGGTQVGTGSPFDPVAAGFVDKNVAGSTTFFAQCECGPCVSTRISAVFTVFPLPESVISGEKFPCPNSTHIYSTPFHTGSSWAWSVISGGTLISQNQNSATIKWGATAGGPHLVSVKETDEHGCMKTAQLAIEIRPTAIVCKSHLNVSLNEMCMATLTPQLLLDGTYPTFDGYTIMITDGQNNPISGTKITGKGFWKFKVTEPCIGNSCWGDLTTEDKLPPKITCAPVTVPCSQTNVAPIIPNLSGMPTLVNIGGIGDVTVEDNCAIVSIDFNDVFMDFDCASTSGFSAKITRTWVATDMTGNTGTCVQIINFSRKYITDVQFPTDFTTNLCENKNQSPLVTGVPTVDGNPIWPSSNYCELNAVFSDQFFPICDGSLKIIRTWTVLDWCLPVSATNPKNFIQVIKFLDKNGPAFDCPASFEASTDAQTCSATVDLPDLLATDYCSRIKSASAYFTLGNGITTTVAASLIDFPGGNTATNDTMVVFPSVTGLPLGQHLINYVVEDDCGNSSKCSFFISINDEIMPVAICQEFTQVGLGASGMAIVDAESFNSGSYDHCAPVFFKVKRMLDSDCLTASVNHFSDFTKFCCSDVNDTVMVILRVYQEEPVAGQVADDYLEGQFNDCMIQVFVEDKLKPTCASPANQTVECAAFDPTLWAYGNAVATDNCEIDTILQSVNSTQFNASCKSGSLIRTWTVIDKGGNTAKCTQKITVEPKTDFWVKFPDDLVLTNCTAGGDYGKPEITGENCETIAISFEDQVFTLQSDACFKIFRTWTIINWCDHDTNWSPAEIDNPTNSTIGANVFADNYNHGFFKYTQVIKVQDDNKPTIVCPSSPTVFLDFSDNDPLLWNAAGHDQCEGLAALTVKGHDLCAGPNLQFGYILKLDLDGDGTMETNWNSNLPGTPAVESSFDASTGETTGSIPGLILPYGIHIVKWIVEDGCGNQDVCEYTFEIKDGKKPTVTCINGLSVNQMQNGSVSLWASDFLLYATDNCTKPGNLAFSIRKIGTGTGFPTTQSVTFGCTELGTQTVELWAKDAAGNSDFCLTYAIISDNTGGCGGSTGTVAGFIKNKKDEGIEAVAVKITGSQPGLPAPDVFTGVDGSYNFNALPLGNDYLITPKKDVNPLNGVSTFDLVAMSKHVLNVAPFTLPWQYFAADINHNGQVTTFDIVELRKLILGIYSDFPANESWRFVEKGFAFDMTANPLGQAFKESISIQNLQNGANSGDFTAVKIGDVNFDAVPNNLFSGEDRTHGKLFFEIDEKEIEAGQPVEIAFRAPDLGEILGWQFTLKFDENALEFDGIAPGKLGNFGIENFGLNRLADGLLTSSWNGETAGISKNEALFTLRFLAKKDGKLSKNLKIGSEITPAEGYNLDAENLELALRFNNPEGTQTVAANQFEVFQNEPNPFSESTKIGFQLPEAGAVSLRIFHSQGRVVFEKTAEFGRGRQAFQVSQKEIGGTGLYFYELKTAAGESGVRKFLVK